MSSITTAASPVGSIILTLLALLIISAVVLLILRYYLPLRTTPAFYLVPIFFALWLPSVVVVLVPIDLASSAATGDEATRGVWLPDRVLLVAWRITYWLTFVLTWFLLPTLAEYSDSGYREPKDKLTYSLGQNARYYAMMLSAGILGLVYVIFSYGVTVISLKGLVMALAYCWGLVLAIYLMGHGLVAIPRRLMRNASIAGRLKRLQTRAPRLYENMDDATLKVEEVEAQIAELSRRKIGSAVDYRDWIEELQDLANIPEGRPTSTTTRGMPSAEQTIPTVITEKFLADLTRRLLRARHKKSRFVDEWGHLVQEAAETQMILDSGASKKLDFGQADPHAGFWDKANVLTPYTRYVLHFQVLPYAQVALGVFLAMASVCIVWSEVIKVAVPKLSIIRLTVVHHWTGDKAEVGFAGQIIAAFWICYMCAAALTSLTEVKVWRGRALVKRNTSHESAFWYALQVAKLSIPLSYNFLTFLSRRVYDKTIFYKFLGELIDLTPLGRWFDDLYPIFILIPVFATLFGLYGRVKRMFVGLDVIDDDEDGPTFGTGSWREGRDLIERELGGNSALRRREDTFARLAAAAGSGGGRTAPVLSVPAARGGASSPARSPVRPTANTYRAGQSSRAPVLDEPEDENMFSIIGHRMKNTMDNFESPQWIQDIKKPKWMGGDEEERPGAERTNSGIRRWFGGEGSVRL